jgi:hypothetical protein
MRRPNHQVSGDEEGSDGRRLHPPPRRETHRGVTMTVRGGTIVLRRSADGRVARIGPRALADADLEPAGLFYAYNLRRNARPGRLAFVPFARLFS